MSCDQSIEVSGHRDVRVTKEVMGEREDHVAQRAFLLVLEPGLGDEAIARQRELAAHADAWAGSGSVRLSDQRGGDALGSARAT